MNLSLMDPKLIVLAAAVVLIIAVLAWLNIRDLDPMEHERFLKRWESVQSRFVDSPKGAVTEADDLVSSLMKTRGYPNIRFRSTCRRHFCGPSPSGGELPVCA
jgi:hypothetical protein